MSIYQHQLELANGDILHLKEYQDKVLLIVNTASYCGFTPQYEALEALYQKYHRQGLDIFAFPCNQFGRQEPKSESDIVSFCSLNYNITFPIFKKVDVNGSQTLPLYRDLKKKAPGLLQTKNIKWNFTKFLVAPHETSIIRYSPQTDPAKMKEKIESFLSISNS